MSCFERPGPVHTIPDLLDTTSSFAVTKQRLVANAYYFDRVGIPIQVLDVKNLHCPLLLTIFGLLRLQSGIV